MKNIPMEFHHPPLGFRQAIIQDKSIQNFPGTLAIGKGFMLSQNPLLLYRLFLTKYEILPRLQKLLTATPG